VGRGAKPRDPEKGSSAAEGIIKGNPAPPFPAEGGFFVMKIYSKRRLKPDEKGMTLVEVMVAAVILAVALFGLLASLSYASRLIRAQKEINIAKNAARGIIESMRMYDTGYIYAYYNSNPLDDPNGPNTAPGDNFSAQGLDAQSGDPDGFVGKIEFPEVTLSDGTDVLSETVTAPELGMPRDLNGDGDADDVDVSQDYRLLPVTVRVQWRSFRPEQEIHLQTLIVERYEPFP